MTTSATEWLTSFAAALGIAPPSDAEREDILSLAGTAAHASERTAAPVACWLAAKAGLAPAEARDLAARLEQRDWKANPDQA
ncbi:MAG TPA: DUF6457 domain-containing protein [Acidimicrobiales bacterium]|nr:DUF6457 domain-containing protein [Acidimicrobiales bacterium]